MFGTRMCGQTLLFIVIANCAITASSCSALSALVFFAGVCGVECFARVCFGGYYDGFREFPAVWGWTAGTVPLSCSIVHTDHVKSWNLSHIFQSWKVLKSCRIQIQKIRTCRVRLTNCPGTLTKCQKAIRNRWDLRSCLNLLVSVMSLMLWGSEFQAAGPSRRSPGKSRKVVEMWFSWCDRFFSSMRTLLCSTYLY